jgi:hypothetical protein
MDKYSTWKEAKNRLTPEAWPEITPSFKINKNDKIFTIGSCFARNIEEHLEELGYNIPMTSFAVPKHEMGPTRRPNGILNKFSPACIFQELSWCEQIYSVGGKVSPNDIEHMLFEQNDGLVIDLHIGGYIPVTKERALRRRQEIYDVFSQAFSSQVVIVTLGLIEAWYDTKENLVIQRYPHDIIQDADGRFKFIRFNYGACYDQVQNTISLIRKHAPGCKFLITTSPIPLKQTFTDEDVIVANTYSKSVLRAVCGEIVEKNKLVDYFPSYENVMMTRGSDVYQEDLRQIKDTFIAQIANRLVEKYT